MGPGTLPRRGARTRLPVAIFYFFDFTGKETYGYLGPSTFSKVGRGYACTPGKVDCGVHDHGPGNGGPVPAPAALSLRAEESKVWERELAHCWALLSIIGTLCPRRIELQSTTIPG